MSDIQTLTSQVEQLERTHGWWKGLTLVFIASTAIVATLYFIVEYIASSKGSALQKAQASLIRAKDEQARLRDEQVKSDLKDKELKIGEARERASQADERAGKATERAEEIAGENIKLKGELDKATAEARRDAENLRRQNLATEERLEKERQTRLEMEAAISPRMITNQQAGVMVEKLKRFAGMKVQIETVSDMEARRAAGQIAAVLQMAGWQLPEVGLIILVDRDLPNGVTVLSNVGAAPRDDHSLDAANLLIEQLNSQKLDSQFTPAGGFSWPGDPPRTGLPPNTVKIQVGMKPGMYEYFLPPDLKEQWKKDEERRKEIEKEVERRRKEAEKRFEEIDRRTKKPE